MATTIVLDTHILTKDLKANGFTEEQATGILQAFQEIDLSQLATKGDLRDMELRLTNRMIAIVGVGVAPGLTQIHLMADPSQNVCRHVHRVGM